MINNIPIDIVIPWVDGSDISWLTKKDSFKLNSDYTQANITPRFRSSSTFKYIFRGIEKFAPWVRYVFLVTDSQTPDFIDINHPKLKLVDHKNFIPDEYLPTFSSHCIELNFHHIKELSENFIYFNDDTYLLKPVGNDYFFKNDLPCYEALFALVFQGDVNWAHVILNDVNFINRHFDKNEMLKEFKHLWFNPIYGDKLKANEAAVYWRDFTGFRNPHFPNPLRKSTLKKIWELESALLDKTCSNKIRTLSDVNQYITQYYDMCSGNFVPTVYNGLRLAVNNENYYNAINAITSDFYDLLTINDNEEVDFEKIDPLISSAFDKILPEKSNFEL